MKQTPTMRLCKLLLPLCFTVLCGIGACTRAPQEPATSAGLGASSSPVDPTAGVFVDLATEAVSGSETSEVTLTLFVDAQQPASREVLSWWMSLRDGFGEHVRLVVVPLPDRRSQESVSAAEWLLTGLHREGPQELRSRLDALMAASRSPEDDNNEGAEAARPERTVGDELRAPFVAERLAHYQHAAAALGIELAPAIFVDGRGLSSVDSQEALKAEIVEAGQRSRAQGLSYAQRVGARYSRVSTTRVAGFETLGDAAVTPWDAESKVPVLASDPVWGDVRAPVTVVEFSDFQCPFCARVQPTLAELKKQYGPAQVRFVWKDNPLPFHDRARPAATAGQVVHQLGGDFWRFHDLAFSAGRELTDQNLARWAVAAGVSPVAFDAAYQDGRFAASLEASIALAGTANLRGTPSFLINGRALSGAQPVERFQALIDEELTAARKLRAAGVAPERISFARTQENFDPEPPPERPETKEASTVYQVPVLPDDPTRGSPTALVTIVEWSDFQCPFCARVEPTLAALQERYGDDLRIVWKDNPLSFHERAGPAARLARLAFRQKGNAAFWRVHDSLFDDSNGLEDADLVALGKEIGLSPRAIKNAIREDATDDKVSANADLAFDLKARGTPHFFINGRRLAGAQPQAEFEALIDEQLVKARALVEAGVPRRDVYARLMAAAEGPAPFETRDAPAVPVDGPARGRAGAPVTIQVFSDFQCPYCGRAVPTLLELERRFPTQVRVVYRHNPLPFHKQATLAAEAAIEAYEQGGDKAFWAMHDVLYGNQKALEREALETYAEQQGLQMTRFRAALDDGRHKDRVQRDLDAGKQAGVSGTPTFFVNNYLVSGAQPLREFEVRVRAALADAAKLKK